MNALRGGFGPRLTVALVLLSLLAGCASPRIDWNSRIGNYTYDQAVLDFGPPDKYAKLADGTSVVEWLTQRGGVYASPAYYGWPGWCGPYYAGYGAVYSSPDYFLRLVFGPDGRLKTWKRFAR